MNDTSEKTAGKARQLIIGLVFLAAVIAIGWTTKDSLIALFRSIHG